MFQALLPVPMPDAHATRRVFLWLLAASMLVKLALAWFLPMGVDEAYATAVAREFSLSFFDHPPIAFWSPVVAANLTGLEHPVIYRLPVLIYGFVSTWLIFALGRELGGDRAALWTVLLYVLSPAFLIAGGAFVLPDGPLELGSLFCALWLVRICKAEGQAPFLWWVWVGLGLAFALASKYQAALIPIAAFGFALIHPVGRKWFAQPGPYVAALIGLLGLLPTLLWNLQHDWASFTFHSGRTGDGFQPVNLALMILGQALYLLPPVLVLAAIGLRHGFDRRWPEIYLTALLAVAPILLFNLIYAFSQRSFPHWTFPGWQFAIPLAGIWLAGQGEQVLRRAWRWLVGAAAVTWFVIAVTVLHINTGILTRGVGPVAPSWDRTETVFDYSGLGPALQDRGLLDDVDLILVPGWINAGLLSTGLGGAYPVRVLGDNPHHFAFMSGVDTTGSALILDIQSLGGGDKRLRPGLRATARGIDPEAQILKPVILQRGGRDYVKVTVIQLNVPEQTASAVSRPIVEVEER